MGGAWSRTMGYQGATTDDGGAAAAQPVPLRLRLANAIAFVACVAVNGFAGGSVGTISHKYPTKIVPDGWAFSIWGIIYTLLIGFVGYQFQTSTPSSSAIVNRVGGLFLLSNAFNAAWILTWIGGTPATVLVSSALLFGLVGTNLAILSRGGAWQSEPPRQWADTLLFDIPFSIYTGWVTVASIVNVGAAGVAYGWADQFLLTSSQWAAVMIAIAGVINAAVLVRRKDPVYPLVYVWATAAIFTGHRDDTVVATTAAIGAVAMLAVDAVGVGLMVRAARNANGAENSPLIGSK